MANALDNVRLLPSGWGTLWTVYLKASAAIETLERYQKYPIPS